MRYDAALTNPNKIYSIPRAAAGIELYIGKYINFTLKLQREKEKKRKQNKAKQKNMVADSSYISSFSIEK